MPMSAFQPGFNDTLCLLPPLPLLPLRFDPFHREGTNDLYAPKPVSPSGAASAVQCFTEYAQMEDTWWLPTAGSIGITTLNGTTSFGDCVDACTASVDSSNNADCQYVTYDYSVDRCYLRKAVNNGMAG